MDHFGGGLTKIMMQRPSKKTGLLCNLWGMITNIKIDYINLQ